MTRKTTILTAAALITLAATAPKAAATPAGVGPARHLAVFTYAVDPTAGATLNCSGVTIGDSDLGVGAFAQASLLSGTLNGGIRRHTNSVVSTSGSWSMTGIEETGVLIDEGLSDAARICGEASQFYAAQNCEMLGDLTSTTEIDVRNGGGDDDDDGGGGGSGVATDHYFEASSIDFQSGDVLRIRGEADDWVVINVTGNCTFDNGRILLYGVQPSRVIFNFPQAGNTIAVSGSDAAIEGTFLAPERAVTFSDSGKWRGAIISGTSVTLNPSSVLIAAGFESDVSAMSAWAELAAFD